MDVQLLLQVGSVIMLWTTLIASVLLGWCTSDVPRREQDPLRYFSTRTAYDVVRNKHMTDENIPGCKAEQVYMVIRHGTRYAGKDEIDAMENVLPAVQKAIVSNPQAGTLDHAELGATEKWQMRMEAKELGISPAGEAELYHIGERLRKKVPGLLHSHIDSREIELRCTDTERSRLSAKSFLQGIYKHSARYSNFTFDPFIEYVPMKEDKLLLFADLCQKYIRSRLDQEDMGRRQLLNFDDGPEVNRIVHLVSQKTGLPTDALNFTMVKTLYEACRFEYAILGESVWCNVFPEEALRLMEYRQDLKYYWRYGHGKSANYQPSCLVLKDILQSFRDTIDRKLSSKKGVFRITHSRTLLPLLTRLGMFNDSLPLLSNNYKDHSKRKWRLSLINPFAANIKFLLYNCNQEYFVRTFLHEREIHLPICDSMFCPLETIEKGWDDLVDSCDFDVLCEHGLRQHIALDDVAAALHTFDGG